MRAACTNDLLHGTLKNQARALFGSGCLGDAEYQGVAGAKIPTELAMDAREEQRRRNAGHSAPASVQADHRLWQAYPLQIRCHHEALLPVQGGISQQCLRRMGESWLLLS